MALVQSKEAEFGLSIALKGDFPGCVGFSLSIEDKYPAIFVLVVLVQGESSVPQLLSKRVHLTGREFLHH